MIKEKIYSLYEKDILTPIHGYPTKFKILGLYLKLKLRYYKNRLKYGDATPDPFKIIYITPEKIQKFSGKEYRPQRKKFQQLGLIKKGGWDEHSFRKLELASREQGETRRYSVYHCDKFQQSIFFKSMKERFQKNKNWEETEYWHFLKSEEYESLPAEEKANKIERSFQKIKEKGYKSSKELAKSKFSNTYFDEVIVDISRDGEFLLRDGRHRTAIANILELNRIPVRVSVRHKEWMKYRSKAINNPEELDKNLTDHPDLQTL